MSAPRLTTMSVPLEQAGRAAVELLLRQSEGNGAGNGSGSGNPISDPQPRGRLLPVRLVVRSSTAAPRRPGGWTSRGSREAADTPHK
jgi:DNA-binding LacI/PurR family transcriptional regulator